MLWGEVVYENGDFPRDMMNLQPDVVTAGTVRKRYLGPKTFTFWEKSHQMCISHFQDILKIFIKINVTFSDIRKDLHR